MSAILHQSRRAVSAWLAGLFLKHSNLEVPEPVETWVKKNVVLSKEESKQFPGLYDPDLSPIVTIIFDFVDSSEWDEFVGVKSSQAGFTLAVLAALMHKIKYNPQDVIMAINNREEIVRIGQTRLRPMLRACRAIQERMPLDEDKLQNMTLYLLGLTIYLMGSHSAGSAANKSAGWCVIDECDESPEELTGGESNIIDLLRDRLKRQDGAKLIAFSKPRNEDDVIWPEYLTGSRHKVFVPCPHCSGDLPKRATEGPRLYSRIPEVWPQGYQTLVRAGLRYEHCKRDNGSWNLEMVLKDTWYQCVHCKGRIEEKDKGWMLKHRLYIPTNTPEGALQDDCKTILADVDRLRDNTDGHPQPMLRKLSFHVSDLYALKSMPRSTWGHLALEIVGANTESKRRKFRRSREGLPVGANQGDNQRSIADIRALAANFKRGHCSREPLNVIMGVDVQHYGKKWVKMAFFEDDSCELVDWGIVTKGFSGLLDEANTPVIVDDWGDVLEEDQINPLVDMGLIDEGDGHYTKSVLAFCVSKGAYPRWLPCKGRGREQAKHMKDLVVPQAKHNYSGVRLSRYLFASDAFAEELYDERIGKAAEIAKALRAGLMPPAGQLRIFQNPDDDLCRELTTHRRWTDEDERQRGQQRRKNKSGRRVKILKVGDWFRDGGPDDFGDAVTMCLAGWYRAKPAHGLIAEGVMADEEDEEGEGEG